MNSKLFGRFILLLGVCLVSGIAGCGSKNSANVNVQSEIQNLSSPDATVRQNACAKLGEAKESAAPAVGQLIGALKDKDDLVRRLAAYALGEIGPKAAQALPALKVAMKDMDSSVAGAAISAIQAIDPKEKVDALPPTVTN